MNRIAGFALFFPLLGCASMAPASPEAKTQAKKSLALGIAHHREGRKTAAEAYFREALGLDPQLLDGYLHLGGLLLETQRGQEAIDLYREGSQRLPGRPELYEDLAFALETSGEKAGAVEALQKALEIRAMLPDTPQNREWIEKDKAGIEALAGRD